MHIEPLTTKLARVVAARRGSMLTLTALGCATVISACGSSSPSTSTTTPGAKATVNLAQVALAIEQTILGKRHLHAKVVCPEVIKSEVGKTFECIATSRGLKPPHTVTTTPFVVTIKTTKGFVEYEGR